MIDKDSGRGFSGVVSTLIHMGDIDIIALICIQVSEGNDVNPVLVTFRDGCSWD